MNIFEATLLLTDELDGAYMTLSKYLPDEVKLRIVHKYQNETFYFEHFISRAAYNLYAFGDIDSWIVREGIRQIRELIDNHDFTKSMHDMHVCDA